MSGRDVAIVGMGCQFPQAPDLAAYWRNIRAGRVCFAEIERSRWNHELFYNANPRETDKTYARKVGHVEGVDLFAAEHYGVAPLRARLMDPQHRLMLDATRMALEDAGYGGRPLQRETVGVYIGISMSEYQHMLLSRNRALQLFDGAYGQAPQVDAAAREASTAAVTPTRAFSMPGTLLNMAAATICMIHDFGGPAYTIDAACASSLVAIHDAVMHLRAGLCDTAIAGGVYLNLIPDAIIAFSRMGAVSRTDACRPFDVAADGFVMGEGVGALVLKRLDDARRDGDRIWAVVRGTGLSNDGTSDGAMVPRQSGQVSVLERAWRDAELSPGTVGFIEAHGTATPVGDPVEAASLRQFLAPHRGADFSCVLSSVKANIGHAMSAAGVAGVIKAVLVLSQRIRPPQAAFQTEDPKLELSANGFRVITAEEPWPQPKTHPRRAGVSSFGFGGTNCHIVLEEAPSETRPARPDRAHPFLLTAPTVPLLARLISELAAALDDGEARQAPVADLAHALATRHPEAVRIGFVAKTREELAQRLREAHAVVGDGTPASDRVWFAAEPAAEPVRAEKLAALELDAGEAARRAAAGDDLLSARLCELAVLGAPITLVGLHGPARPVWLPPTPLEKERHWGIES